MTILAWDFSDFVISKSYVVADINQLISAMKAHLDQGGTLTPEAMSLIIANLHHNLDDMEENLMSPYEADAMEMAIRSGNLLDVYGRAYHAGPEDPNYEKALEEGFRIGKPMVNQAAKRQNDLNAQRGIGPVDLPFDEIGSNPAVWKVNAKHRGRVAATVNAQKNKDGSFNPFHTKTGQLVTDIISGHSGRKEGYARWYEEAAKQEGFIEVRRNKSGKVADRKTYVIPAHYINRDLVTINDKDMKNLIGYGAQDSYAEAHAQGFNDQQVADYMRQKFMNMPVVYYHSHMGHHNFDATHDRNSRKAEEARMILEDEEPMPMEGEDPSQVTPPGVGNASEDILHPDLEGYLKNLGKGSYNPLTKKTTNKKLIGDIARSHDMDEDDVRAIIHNAYTPKGQRDVNAPGGRGGSTKQRILNAIYDHHMEKDGYHPEWYNGPHVEISEKPPETATESIVEPPVTETPQTTQMPLNEPPAHIPRDPPSPPPATLPPASAPKTLPYVPPWDPYTAGKEHIQSLQSRLDSLGGRTKLSGLAELLGTLSTTDIFRRSDDLKPEIENYMESVQLELAKSVIDDLTPLGNLAVDSPLDVALLSSKVQMGTNDVITIFHTRGDWREIAKSFNIPHSSVQMVKVALHA